MSEGYSRVCALNPGVMGETGIETSDIIEAIVKKNKAQLHNSYRFFSKQFYRKT